MLFTRTPYGASSAAIACVNAITPAFVAEYAAVRGYGSQPKIELTVTIEPRRASRSTRPAAGQEDAAPVHRDDPVELRGLEVDELHLVAPDACVRDRQLDPAEALDRIRDEAVDVCLHRRRPDAVCDRPVCEPVLRRDAPGGRLDLGVVVEEQHRPAVAGEPLRDALAEPTGRARDDCGVRATVARHASTSTPAGSWASACSAISAQVVIQTSSCEPT